MDYKTAPELIRGLPIGELIRFAVTGTVNTLVHLGVYFALVATGVKPVPASVPAFIMAVIVSYILNRNWVFSNRGSHRRQFTRFLTVVVGGLGINIAMMYLMVEQLGQNHRIGLGLTVICLTVWSYAANKLWTFGNLEADLQIKQDDEANRQDNRSYE